MQVPGGRLAELFGTKRVFGFCTSVDPPFIFYILTANLTCVSNIIIIMITFSQYLPGFFVGYWPRWLHLLQTILNPPSAFQPCRFNRGHMLSDVMIVNYAKQYHICGAVHITQAKCIIPGKFNLQGHQSYLWHPRIWLHQIKCHHGHIFRHENGLETPMRMNLTFALLKYLTPGVPWDCCKAFSSHLAFPPLTRSQIGDQNS